MSPINKTRHGLVYFYQSVGYILTTNGVRSSLYGFAELFNLNILTAISLGSDGSDSTGYCLFKDMTTPQKLAVQLIASGSILFFIVLFSALNKFVSINIYKHFKREINYGQTLLTAWLIVVGQVLSITFQLLACRNIGENKSVHYFFGYEECFGGIWIVSFLALIFVIGSFILLFVYIGRHKKKEKVSQRKLTMNTERQLFFYSVIRTYDEEYWFWELVLFMRRLLFAFMFIVFDNDDLKILVGILLSVYLFIHLKYLPFRWNYVNKLDSYLIVAISIVIFMNASSSNLHQTFYDLIITLILLFPMFYYLWFGISNRGALKNRKKNDSTENDDNNKNNIELVNKKSYDIGDNEDKSDTLKMHLITNQNKHEL